MNHLWWYLARSSGLVAWFLLMASLGLGIVASGRLAQRPRLRRWVLDLHPWISGIALGAVGLHVAAIVADSFVEITPEQALVPFASPWREAAVAWGAIGAWLLVLVQLTSLLRRRLPRRLWRSIHLTSYVLAGLVTVHALTAGTDAARRPLRVVIGLVTALVVALTVRRAFGPTRPPRTTRPGLPSGAADNGTRAVATPRPVAG